MLLLSTFTLISIDVTIRLVILIQRPPLPPDSVMPIFATIFSQHRKFKGARAHRVLLRLTVTQLVFSSDDLRRNL